MKKRSATLHISSKTGMWNVVCLSLESSKTEISTLNLIRNYAIKCGL